MFKRRKPDDPATAPTTETVAMSPHAFPEPRPAQVPVADGSRFIPPAGPPPRPPAAPQRPADNGLDVPVFRPATPAAASAARKEAPDMGRAPFAAPPAPPAGGGTGMPPQPMSQPPGLPPRPPQPMAGREMGMPRPGSSDRRTLVVGRGISLQGTVTDAERLVVEGTVEASMIHATELSVSPGGVFKGEVEVEDAEVAGTIDGTLTARGSMIVRSTGRVLGTARCRRLQVEDGGQITGRMEMLTETTKSESTRPVETAA